MDARDGETIRAVRFGAPLVKFFLIGVAFLIALFLLKNANLIDYFPIRTVKIYGINRLSEDEVKSTVMPLVERDFFTINVESIRDSLLDIPWISELYVRRIWPDQVMITIKEKNPIARWNDAAVLSDAGELFSPSHLNAEHLVQFKGPEGQHMLMLSYLNHINQHLIPLHAKVDYLELTPYFTWRMRLSNGINLQVGHKDILTRLDQFVKVYPKIVGNKALNVEYIDLRYPNGMAVRWKT